MKNINPKKILKIIAITIGVFLIGIILTYIFEGDIKKYALQEINKTLKVKVKIDEKDISFSLFKKFPKASLTFNNFLLEEENEKDTLLFSKKLSLVFGLGSVLSENYSVEKINISDAVVNLRVDNQGHPNYFVVKESAEKDTVNTKFNFKLKEVNFKNVALNYLDIKGNFEGNLILNKTKFSGDFSEKNSELNINSKHLIKNISRDSVVLFQNKKGSLLMNKGDFSSEHITLKEGSVSIEDMEVNFDGSYVFKNGKTDFNAIASNIEISDIFSLLPNEISEKLQEYSTRGNINGSFNFKKNKWNPPTISSDFKIKEGVIKEKSTGAELTKLNLEGSFNSSPNSQKLDISKITGNVAGGNFSGKGKMIGKNKSTIFSSFQGNFNLKELGQFLNLEEIESVNGKMVINNNFSGTINPNDGKITISEFNGNTSLTKMNLKLKSKPENFSNLTGNIKFNRLKSTASFTGYYGESDLSLSTQFSNFIPYLLYDKNLNSNVYLQSKNLNLDKLLETNETSNSSKSDTNTINFPKNITASISTKIEKLIYGNHVFKNVNGNFKMTENGIGTVNNITTQANNGNYILNGKLSKTNTGFTLNSKVIIGQIEIKDLFQKFEDFGQKILVNRHLEGKANAIITIRANYNSFLEMDMNSLDVSTELSIINGELIKFELFDEIADYLKSNVIAKKMLNVEELSKKLRHVVFQELSNKIEIKNGKLTIPDMVIKSNAMDIGVYGTQTFEGDINYGINFRLSDIMTKKKESEFGYIVDDGTGTRVFLLITGTIDNPIFKLDKAGRKEFNKQKREEEKNTLKNILKDEFGFFKKDTSLKEIPVKEKPKPKIEVEWGEEEPSVTPSKNAQESTPKVEEKKEVKPKKKSWLDKLKEKEEKPKKKVGFEFE